MINIYSGAENWLTRFDVLTAEQKAVWARGLWREATKECRVLKVWSKLDAAIRRHKQLLLLTKPNLG